MTKKTPIIDEAIAIGCGAGGIEEQIVAAFRSALPRRPSLEWVAQMTRVIWETSIVRSDRLGAAEILAVYCEQPLWKELWE